MGSKGNTQDGGVITFAPGECTLEDLARHQAQYNEPTRPSLKDEAERLLSYWEAHGDNPETVAKWAVSDMLGILRYVLEDEA